MFPQPVIYTAAGLAGAYVPTKANGVEYTTPVSQPTNGAACVFWQAVVLFEPTRTLGHELINLRALYTGRVKIRLHLLTFFLMPTR